MKKGLLFFAFLFTALSLLAQDDEPKKGFQREKLFIGGNFGLSFGNYTLINFTPQLGYRFNRFLEAGIGINGNYFSKNERDPIGNPYFKTISTSVGLNLFGRVYPFKYLMFQVQPESNYRFGKIRWYDGTLPSVTKLDAEVIPSVLAGGGLVLPSGRGAFIISIMYDVLQDKNSLYGKKPLFSFNYNVNLYR